MNLTVDLVSTLPVLAPVVAAVLVLLLDAALPRQRVAHLAVAAAGLAGGVLATVLTLLDGSVAPRTAFCTGAGECWYSADRLATALQLGALGAALVVLVLAWREWVRPSPTDRTAVVVALLLGATAGTAALPAAGDLGSLLVALELATVPTVALVVLTDHRWSAGRRAAAVDGAIALLTTSLVSFGLLALGAALWVAATGSAMLGGDGSGAAGTAAGTAGLVSHPGLLALAVVFMVAGLAFKLSAVPFHSWTPLTYTSAPLPVTAYLATVSKVAALGALVVLVRALGAVEGTSLVVVGVLAVLSMTVGNVVALGQNAAVRLLAWSTVAQAGWVLLPLAALTPEAPRAAGSYLLVYLVATLLAFVVVVAVAQQDVSGGTGAAGVPQGTGADGVPLETGADDVPPRTDAAGVSQGTGVDDVQEKALDVQEKALDVPLAAFDGALRTRPALAIPLGLALLTLAGLPPAIAGLVAKVVALAPAVAEGIWWLAVVAAINVALGIAVYLRWLVRLLRPAQPAADGAAAPPGIPVAWWVLIVVLSSLLVVGSLVPIGMV